MDRTLKEAIAHFIQRTRQQNWHRKANDQGIDAEAQGIFEQCPEDGIAKEEIEVFEPCPRAAPDAGHNVVILERDHRVGHGDIAKDKKIEQGRQHNQIELPVTA